MSDTTQRPTSTGDFIDARAVWGKESTALKKLAEDFSTSFNKDFAAILAYHKWRPTVMMESIRDGLSLNNDSNGLLALDAQTKYLTLANSLIYDNAGSDVFVRPADMLARNDYAKVKEVLQYAGGQYVNTSKGFKFPAHTKMEDLTRKIEASAFNLDSGKKINSQDFFPTPPEAAHRMMEVAVDENDVLTYGDGGYNRPIRILEPGAGNGALISAFINFAKEKLAAANANSTSPADSMSLSSKIEIVAVESDPILAETLRHDFAHVEVDGTPIKVTVIEADFLGLTENDLGGPFDSVFMNPPFKDALEFQGKAMSLLDKNGSIASILPSLPSKEKASSSKENDFARDALFMASTSYAHHETFDSGVFNSKTNAYGAKTKTSIETSLLVFHAPLDQGAITDAFNLAVFSNLQNQSAVHKICSDLLSKKIKTSNEGCQNFDAQEVRQITKQIGEAIIKDQVSIARENGHIPASLKPEYIGAGAALTILEDQCSEAGMLELQKILVEETPFCPGDNFFNQIKRLSEQANIRLHTAHHEISQEPAFATVTLTDLHTASVPQGPTPQPPAAPAPLPTRSGPTEQLSFL